MLEFHSDKLLINAAAYVATGENQLYVENEATEVTAQIIARVLQPSRYFTF